ncbi:type IV pili methyl-accepting chemotaxis transducer N-terminal domain-containing protein [Conchiformibius steedae]|uniref:Sensor protein n=1 Tax=Conchiformibius steedae TaxID=153493 RepID=A0A3P2A422_9NEIS|nr:type IV pili methyl-accepting chemotaxis transducer N-terminal domain-containing protein [Conchiformibius steedae]RRD90197.1 HAMP domain-containing protein [Conchiformibius steedae]
MNLSALLPRSLSHRLKLLTLLWLIVALASIILTLLLSWRLEGGAAAINDAGSLRMQTYHLGLAVNTRLPAERIHAQIRRFDHTLATLEHGDPRRPLFLPDNADVSRRLHHLQHAWHGHIKPLFERSAAQGSSVDESTLAHFIAAIDGLTLAVEAVNTNHIKWLRFFQTALLAMVVVSAAVTVLLLSAWIIRPLQTLQSGVQDVHDGRFGVQVPVSDSSEFAQVDSGFNQMSTRLQQLYHGLEQEVADKTRDLVHKNETLQTLYFFSRFLNQSQTAAEAAAGFLEKIISIVPAQAGSIRLVDFERSRLDLIAHHGLPPTLQNAAACRILDDCLCGQSVRNDQWQPIIFDKLPPLPHTEAVCRQSGFTHLRIFKIACNGQDLGMMTLYFAEPYAFERTGELIEALCSQFGVALSHIRLIGESRRLAVLQERNLMAQGLHDSIAQTLTFLNLQVQMLESAIAANEHAQIKENLNFIKEGVQECYEDVRELLLNFRTKITRKEFAEAVQTLAQRFEQQTHVAVSVRWQGDGQPLSSEQELQFIFILQESLSNIRKHAQAQHVAVDFDNGRDFVMTITDNGRGFDTRRPLASSHVGLGIMRERARRIRAELDIQSHPNRYTRIRLTLPQSERILE